MACVVVENKGKNVFICSYKIMIGYLFLQRAQNKTNEVPFYEALCTQNPPHKQPHWKGKFICIEPLRYRGN